MPFQKINFCHIFEVLLTEINLFAALQRLRGHCNLSDEMEEMLAEQAAIKGQKPKNLLSLVQDPLLRRQLLTIVVLSSAMQLCGNDSVSQNL